MERAHMGFERNKIRRIYYISSISIVLLLVVIINVMHLQTLDQEIEQKINQLSENAVSMKQLYIRGIVENVIQKIEIERELIVEDYSNQIAKYILKINAYLKEYEDFSDIEQILKESFKYEDYIILSLRHESGQTYKSQDVSFLDESFEIAEKVLVQGSSYQIGILESDIDALNIEHMKKYIRQIRLADQGYVWVNQILNYKGGDDYAIRLVHPNLVRTEGDYLSTNTMDSEGNQPYAIELDGIKKDGELFFEYSFKKMNSEDVSHKMSIAKLYAPYDWVVATGVHLDDVDQLIKKEKENFQEDFNRMKWLAFVVSFVALIASVIGILIFERRLHRVIRRYTDAIEEQNKSLEKEKDKMKALAYVDDLTQIINRRSMDAILKNIMEESKLENYTFGLLLGDVDHFKHINDNYGHNFGDIVLKEIADLMKENTRRDDYISRWGGEEFLVVFRYVNEREAFQAAEKLRLAIESHDFNYNDEIVKCTISFGLVLYNKEDIDKKALVKIADDAMYQAKAKGRNQVVKCPLPLN